MPQGTSERPGAGAVTESGQATPVHRFREFALRERDSTPPSDGSAALRTTLRRSFPLPSDTYIAETIPVLLARLSLTR